MEYLKELDSNVAIALIIGGTIVICCFIYCFFKALTS